MLNPPPPHTKKKNTEREKKNISADMDENVKNECKIKNSKSPSHAPKYCKFLISRQSLF